MAAAAAIEGRLVDVRSLSHFSQISGNKIDLEYSETVEAQQVHPHTFVCVCLCVCPAVCVCVSGSVFKCLCLCLCLALAVSSIPVYTLSSPLCIILVVII